MNAPQDIELENDGFPNQVPITEEFFINFLSKFEKLQVVQLAHCTAVGDSCLSFLGNFCKDLRCVPLLYKYSSSISCINNKLTFLVNSMSPDAQP